MLRQENLERKAIKAAWRRIKYVLPQLTRYATGVAAEEDNDSVIE
jgi:hypothetical protein